MIRLGVIGAGHWGPNLIRNFDTSNRAELVAVADISEERLRMIEERFPGIRLTRDPGDIIGAGDIDAVVIATPSSTHTGLALEAARAGKHLLIEKPLASSLADAEAIERAFDGTGLVLLTGHVFIFNPAVRRLKEIVASGALGRVLYLHSTRVNLGPIRTDVDCHWDLAPHDISILRYILGDEPLSALAMGGSYINPPILDLVAASMRFEGGIIASMRCGWLDPVKVREIVIVGDEKMLLFDDLSENPLTLFDKTVLDPRYEKDYADTFSSFRTLIREGPAEIVDVPKGEPLRAECEHFLDLMEGRARPEVTPGDGVMVVRILDAISRSVRERREVGIGNSR